MSNKETFSADWLRQREPFDTVARDHAAERLRLSARLRAVRPDGGVPWRVIDLACGTGANLRWLAPRLVGEQEWLVVDHDAALLQRWPERLALDGDNANFHQPLAYSGTAFHARIVRQQTDLARQLHTLPWHAAHLVTASALLDLVSLDWLQQMVGHAAAARVALLFTLSVDGRHQWTPKDPQDATVARLFQAHQRRNKGFGPALGPEAIEACRGVMLAAGYRVFSAASDWRLDGRAQPNAAALQCALADGMAAAASEQDPASERSMTAWRDRRRANATASSLRVGHVDVLALPPTH
ncbi:class I SAM-dependent methyltransferase [Hydrogenophaga sp.]|uniref:class I SAM-dependent methyltransferase n=1 Tax=Hydrogenophaga sp. TaxID=1904254 RepID=UPI002728BBE5|nr:class I SAM-dependent methyltransferase [Hydrogenophaga sp.]MDO9438892.1 class I SAM-dependent methyltransferase [Hydrogenophaga sp.]